MFRRRFNRSWTTSPSQWLSWRINAAVLRSSGKCLILTRPRSTCSSRSMRCTQRCMVPVQDGTYRQTLPASGTDRSGQSSLFVSGVTNHTHSRHLCSQSWNERRHNQGNIFKLIKLCVIMWVRISVSQLTWLCLFVSYYICVDLHTWSMCGWQVKTVWSLCYTWAVSGFSLLSCVAVWVLSLLPCVPDVYRVFYVRLSVYVLTILKEKIIIIIIIIIIIMFHAHV